MKNFDESRASRRITEEERTFQIHGETFVLRSGVRPEALTPFDAIADDANVVETMAALDALFAELVDDRDGAHARFKTIRSDDSDPLTIEDLQELMEWMVETVTGRPTGSRSASTAGREGTGTSLTDASSSQVLQAV